MSQERLIKKYANRRLYDASQSRHITLDDIRGLIVKGEKLKVVEDKTGHDITRHILLQVIAEQEQFGRPILSTKVLEAIIRFYGNAMQGLLASFLEKSIETFLKQQEALQAQISKIVAHTPLATVADHIDHVCQLAGSARHVAIGSDFDGGFGREHVPAEIDTHRDLRKLADALAGRGYNSDDTALIMGGNWERFYAQTLP